MSEPFVPDDFDPPTALVTDDFRLEPLGPQHNAADLAAWTSSIDHIRATKGFPDGDGWAPTGRGGVRTATAVEWTAGTVPVGPADQFSPAQTPAAPR